MSSLKTRLSILEAKFAAGRAGDLLDLIFRAACYGDQDAREQLERLHAAGKVGDFYAVIDALAPAAGQQWATDPGAESEGIAEARPIL